MKIILKTLLLLSLPLFFISADRSGHFSLNKTEQINVPDSIDMAVFANLSRKNFEKITGRKPGLFERFIFKRAQKKIKKQPDWVFDERKVPAEGYYSITLGFSSFLPLLIAGPSGVDCEDNCPNPLWAIYGISALLAALFLGVAYIIKVSGDNKKWKWGCGGILLAGLGVLLLTLALAGFAF